MLHGEVLIYGYHGSCENYWLGDKGIKGTLKLTNYRVLNHIYYLLSNN